MTKWMIIFNCLFIGVTVASDKEVIVTMQTKKWAHILNENFLSLTVTPEVALQLQDFSQITMSMLKGLSPTMLRLGGPSSDKMKYIPQKNSSDNFTITEAQWRRLNQFIEDVNLNLIVCLNSKERVHGVWESRDALELIYSSDKNKYKLGWELGYESQSLLKDGVSGSQLGRDVTRMKTILGDFPLYSESPVIGPDIKSLSNPEEVRFLRDYLTESADSLTAITWHPQFSSVEAEKEDVNHNLLGIIHDMESLIWNKNNEIKSPIQPPPRKPIWLAESKSEEYTGNFADSLTWAKRLGAAARLGFPVIMKKMTSASLSTPTPDYWVSLLYKTLVGEAVLDVRYMFGNRSSLQVFSHCAQMRRDESESVLAPGVRYTQGSVVLYGLNLDDQETRLTVRGNVKEESAHKYVLTAAEAAHDDIEASDEDEKENRKRQTPAKTLLNGELLSLLPNGELPTIKPIEMRSSRSLSFNIPGQSVFFLVLPEMKLKTCMSVKNNIQGSIDKKNAIEKSQSIKSIIPAGVDRDEENTGLDLSPDKYNNLESKLTSDIHMDGFRKSSRGIDLKGKLSETKNTERDQTIMRKDRKIENPNAQSGLGPITSLRSHASLPKSRISLNYRAKLIERENALKDQIRMIKQNPTYKAKVIDGVDGNLKRHEEDPFNDHEQAITNTRFVMFSDDDWMSDFTRAKESVEVAREAIAAFDEANDKQQQEMFKLPQNSFEEQIMGEKISPSRRMINDANVTTFEKNNQTSENYYRVPKSINNESETPDKVYNRERRDNKAQEYFTEKNILAISRFEQNGYNEGMQGPSETSAPVSMSILHTNKIVEAIPGSQIFGSADIQVSSVKNSNYKTQDQSGGMRDPDKNGPVIDCDSSANPDFSSRKFELDEMVLKKDSQEENECFGKIESNLKIVTESGMQNKENDEILKQKAERELNNYFEEISNGYMPIENTEIGSKSSESSLEDYSGEEQDLQQKTISLNNVNNKSCNISFNKTKNGLADSVNHKTVATESSFDKDEYSNQKPSMNHLDRLEGADLSERDLFAEKDKPIERGRRQMSISSPFNYYDPRYMVNQLTFNEIKKIIDELAARKQEVSYVMLNGQEPHEDELEGSRSEPSVTDQIEIADDSLTTSGALDESATCFNGETENTSEKNELSSIDEEDMIGNDDKIEQTNRLYRREQLSINTPVIDSSTDSYSNHQDITDSGENYDQNLEAPTAEDGHYHLTDEMNGNEHKQFPRNISFTSYSMDISSNEDMTDAHIPGETTELIYGDIHLMEVNEQSNIPSTYSKILTVVKNDKVEESGNVLKGSKENTVFAPKINLTQVRLERIEALKNRLLEGRKKIGKSNIIIATENPSRILKEISIENTKYNDVPKNSEGIPVGYLEQGAPTCKASRSAPYVEGMENWNNRSEIVSKEEDKKQLEGQNVDLNLSKQSRSSINIHKSKESKSETENFFSKNDNPPIILSDISGINKIQDKLFRANKDQGTLNAISRSELNSNFMLIPTSYALVPLKSKNSRAMKISQTPRLPLSIDSSHLNKYGADQEENSQDSCEEEEEEEREIEFKTAAGNIIPPSFPLTKADPFTAQSFLKTYGREKRSPDDKIEGTDIPKRGLLRIRGLNREDKGLEKNAVRNDNKMNILSPKLTFEQIKAKASARLHSLRESMGNFRLKDRALAKNRETRAIDGDRRVKAIVASSLPDELATNEIPKRLGEYISHFEPETDADHILSQAEFEKNMFGYKSLNKNIPKVPQKYPITRKSNIIHDLDGDATSHVGGERAVRAKDYMDKDYIVERMSMTDRAVVGLKHSVEELENTAKEILDKVSTTGNSRVGERKKPWMQNVLQGISGRESDGFGLGRPRETRRPGALAFLNPFIDMALKFMRTLGIIS